VSPMVAVYFERPQSKFLPVFILWVYVCVLCVCVCVCIYIYIERERERERKREKYKHVTRGRVLFSL
jgi:formate hydrogenlyase subunit 6/NADH:ubiquinone oxidoreductase subunit I